MTKNQQTEDDTKIALIAKDISYIQVDIANTKKNIEDIKTALKEGYATKESLIEVARDVEKRLVALEHSSNLWKFLSPTLAAVLGSVLTFLIIQYLANK